MGKYEDFLLTEMPYGTVNGFHIDFQLEKKGWNNRLISLIKNTSAGNIDKLLSPFYLLDYKGVLLRKFNLLDDKEKSNLLSYLPQKFIEDMELN